MNELTSAKVNKKFISLKKKLNEINIELADLQEACQHVNATHTNKSSTGNYDPSADQYWTTHKCADCGKVWTTDQYWDRK